MSATNSRDKFDEDESEIAFYLKTVKCGNILFHGIDIIVGVLILCDSLVLLANIHSFVGFLLPVYFAIFGCLMFGFTIYVPAMMNLYIPFYFTFTGRGIAFLLLGSMVLVFEHSFSIATGVITIIAAFVYFIFAIWTKWFSHYDFGCNQLPPPLAQRDADHPDKDNQERRELTPESSEDKKDLKERDIETGQHLSRHIDTNEQFVKHEGNREQYGDAVCVEDEENLL